MYLRHQGPFPVTASDIRSAVGMVSTEFDTFIALGIQTCTSDLSPLTESTWAVADEDGYFGRAVAGLAKGCPVTVGDGRFQLPGTDRRWFRDVTVQGDPAKIAEAESRALKWFYDQRDLVDALTDERRARAEPKAVIVDGEWTTEVRSRWRDGAGQREVVLQVA